jgi:hypothetical protein
MRVRSRVENHSRGPLARIVQSIDQLPLAVRLKTTHSHTQIVPTGNQFFVDIFQREITVNVWLTPAQQIQIWSMQDQYAFHLIAPLKGNKLCVTE